MNGKFATFILISIFTSCGQKKVSEIKYEFFYGWFNEGSCRRFEKRIYEIEDDRFIEMVQLLDTADNILNREQRALYRTEVGVDLLVRGKRIQYLNLKSKNCVKYMDPMGFLVETCFKNRLNYKGHKNAIEYTEEPLIVDGVRNTIYLDSNYCLIDKFPIRAEIYDSLIRIDQRAWL